MTIGALSGIAAAVPAMPSQPAAASTGASAAGGSSSFANAITDAIGNLDSSQQKADGFAQQIASGDLRDVHDYMIAATEASVATELTLAIRNKVVEAFNQIMQMPV